MFALLPDELLLYIQDFLDPASIGSLACVDRRFNATCNDRVFWKRHLQKALNISLAIDPWNHLERQLLGSYEWHLSPPYAKESWPHDLRQLRLRMQQLSYVRLKSVALTSVPALKATCAVERRIFPCLRRLFHTQGRKQCINSPFVSFIDGKPLHFGMIFRFDGGGVVMRDPLGREHLFKRLKSGILISVQQLWKERADYVLFCYGEKKLFRFLQPLSAYRGCGHLIQQGKIIDLIAFETLLSQL